MGSGLSAFERAVAGEYRVALDTSACIYRMARTEPWVSMIDVLMSDSMMGRRVLFISSLAQLEMLVLPLRKRDQREVQRVLDLTEDTKGVHLVEVSRSEIMMAAAIRAQARLRLPDAVVAASAALAGCSILIGNDKDFRALDAFDAAQSAPTTVTPRMPRYVHLDDYVG